MELSAVPVVAAPAAMVLVSVALELLLPFAVVGVAAVAPPGLAVEPVVVHCRVLPPIKG